jgi:hypothetical protein
MEMASQTLTVLNESSHHPPGGDSTLRALTQAVSIQLGHVAAAWGDAVWNIVDDANARGFRIVLLDNEKQGSDAGYHDVDCHGRPYARVFMNAILNHGGRWLRGSNSVSATVSHEACELVIDPATNRWAQDSDGSLWWLEVCDPVESYVYSVALRDGSQVSVSDFVHPDWCNPLAPRGARFDEMRRLKRPFEVAPGGYGTRIQNGNVRTVWGPSYPRWRKRTKQACGSRTWRRRTFGRTCESA